MTGRKGPTVCNAGVNRRPVSHSSSISHSTAPTSQGTDASLGKSIATRVRRLISLLSLQSVGRAQPPAVGRREHEDGQRLGDVALQPLGELRGGVPVLADPEAQAPLRLLLLVGGVEDRRQVLGDLAAHRHPRDVGHGVLGEVELASLRFLTGKQEYEPDTTLTCRGSRDRRRSVPSRCRYRRPRHWRSPSLRGRGPCRRHRSRRRPLRRRPTGPQPAGCAGHRDAHRCRVREHGAGRFGAFSSARRGPGAGLSLVCRPGWQGGPHPQSPRQSRNVTATGGGILLGPSAGTGRQAGPRACLKAGWRDWWRGGRGAGPEAS